MKRNLSPLLIILALSACGSPRPQEGRILKQAIGGDIASIDPHLMTDHPSYVTVGYNCFEGLFRLNEKTAETELGLAESYQVSEDGLTYTFILKEGIVFSDQTPLTAQTFVDSWQRLVDPKTHSGTAYMLGGILKNGMAINQGALPPESLGVQALDDRTLKVNLEFPAPYLKEVLAIPSAVPLPMHLVKENPQRWTRTSPVVSNGAFVVSQWRPGSRVTLTKNPSYDQADQVHLDTIITYTTEDTNTAYNMYINNELDLLLSWPPDKAEIVKHRADYHVAPYTNSFFLNLNLNKKPLNDVRVRRALAKAIDRKKFTEQISRAGARPLYAFIGAMPGYPSQNYLKEDLKMAKALLAEAGYPNGKGFPSLVFLHTTTENSKLLAEFIQEEWKQKLGIDIRLQGQEWKTFLKAKSDFDFDMLSIGWLPDYSDPMAMLSYFLSQSDNSNWNNAEFDKNSRKPIESKILINA